MTVNSLVNFGVPGIQGQRSAPLQPIMRNKFRILFEKFGNPDAETYVVTQQVRSVTLPQIDFLRLEPPLRIKFLDDITSGVLRHVLAQCTRQRGTEESNEFEMRVELLSGGPSASTGPAILRLYQFAGCKIEKLQSQDLAYEDAAGLEFLIDVEYSKFEVFDADGVKLW